jgi:hypothetical protein
MTNNASYFGIACDPITYRSSIACFKTRKIATICAKKMISYKRKYEVYPTIRELQYEKIYQKHNEDLLGYGELQIIQTNLNNMEYFFTVQNISLLMCDSDDALQYIDYPFVLMDYRVYGNIMDIRLDSNPNLDSRQNFGNNLDVV